MTRSVREIEICYCALSPAVCVCLLGFILFAATVAVVVVACNLTLRQLLLPTRDTKREKEKDREEEFLSVFV